MSFDNIKKLCSQTLLHAAQSSLQNFMWAVFNAVHVYAFAREDCKVVTRVKFERKSLECCQQAVGKFFKSSKCL